MTQLLFLCTGNYYRSRLAEIYFNHLAAAQPTSWQAESRGLQITPGNVGPLSPHTREWLMQQKIPLPEPLRFPIPAREADFWTAGHIVALKEEEHRPMMKKYFPQWEGRVEFWNIHDIDFAEPAVAIPPLVKLVEQLFERLSATGR